jgi:hypothetical protein
VASPDKSTVAFLAEQGTTIAVFTVPIGGGTPKRLDVSGTTLDASSILTGWR